VLRRNGLGRGDRLALYLPKTHNAVITMLAALKAGITYVPIDPHAPAPRAALILGDCAVRCVVTTTDGAAQLEAAMADLPSLEMVLLADVDEAAPSVAGRRAIAWGALGGVVPEAVPNESIEDDPAYLLYTSGSTGRPKGVVLTHRNALAFVDWGGITFGVTAEDRLSNHAPLHFDLSVFDIFVALRAGACVVLVPDDVAPFPGTLAEWIETERISVWYSVPSALIRLLMHGRLDRFRFPALRTILFAGEVFAVKYLRELVERLPNVDFYNLYGPTETNVCTFLKVPRPLPAEDTPLSIGSACANTEVFALDEQGRKVGVGEEGELYVRGPTVMPGYWGNPARSDAVLVRNPLQQAFTERAYRTGDIVRLDPDGTYGFLGRRDHMVKSRGYRIELGEIEHALHQHPDVREAVVVATPDEKIGARLTAVVALNEGASASPRELQTFCATRIPRYMVPESIVLRDALPRTSTGKADRQALADMLSHQLEVIGS
jgi:amino acid adenylation domain-containing protein